MIYNCNEGHQIRRHRKTGMDLLEDFKSLQLTAAMAVKQSIHRKVPLPQKLLLDIQQLTISESYRIV